MMHRAADVLGEALVAGGVPEAADHGYHFPWYLSQIALTCIGPQAGKEQTCVLLDDWIPEPRRLDRAEALRELAVRFVRGGAPVNRHDFARWTGLTRTDAKAGLAAAADVLSEVDCATTGGTTPLWGTTDALDALPDLGDPEPVVMLPGFDEYMLGYGDRSAMLVPEPAQRICPGNSGVFQPTVVADGTVVGTWKRTLKRSTAAITIDAFEPLPEPVLRHLDDTADRYAEFHGRTAAITQLAG